ncbi:hemolysin family protein [Streptomyces aidingensis]|uniref:Hemolysin, contains CBS domains n=1 Tax=Streptomyces aidingensis TaxID=910347 RepID=A0A1I1QBT5_9ACTN|nr:hemolysin family protein [Streptomyces aidingensis]SFD19559.1 Hemolysin, contains CBS domains [Streptomyces aidingensis]
MSAALGLLAVLVLTAGTGYFVAQEFAFVAADRLELTREAEAGDKRAARAVRVQQRLSFMLSGAQLGITVTGLIVGFLAEPSVAALLDPVIGALGVPDAAVHGIALVLAFVLATGIQMVLGELGPKNLALAVPERLAKALAGSTLLYLKATGPLIRVFDTAANRLLRRVGIEPVEELHHGATAEELGHLILESSEHGQLPRSTAELLDHALDFSERTLGEVMVPRVDVEHVRSGTTAAEVVELIARRGHSHYPVVADRVDDVVGVIGVRELMRLSPARMRRVTAGALARPPLLLPDSLPLPRAVEQMQDASSEFAVVLDEYGGLAGIVTLEDIAEELVGEIADESDRVTAVAVRAEDGSGAWLVDAGRRVDEIADVTGIPLPEDDSFETMAGLVVENLGRFPEVGDRITVGLRDGHHAGIEVLAMDRHVPERVRLALLPAGSAQPSRQEQNA